MKDLKVLTLTWEEEEKRITYHGNMLLIEALSLIQQIMINEARKQAVEEYKKEQTNATNL